MRYLSDTYFSSYWQRYDLQALLCRDDDEILVWPDNVRNNCVDMFTDMVRTQGVPVQGDDIWYIEDPAAAGASYLMWLPAECDGVHVNLFLKLDAVAFNDKTGYPQLLLDGRTYNTPTPKGYSYAIYHRQELVQHQGDYEYNLSSKAYDAAAASSGLVYDKPYRHYVYRNRAPFTIVVTRHQYTLIHCIIFFSCILLTFFSLLSVGFASLFLARRRARPAWNFRNKIQFAMVGLLTVVIGAVYIGTVTYLVNQLRAKDRESLNERLQAVYSELLNITGGDTELYLTGGADGTNSRLNAVLVSLSNVFYTDIHVFRPDGRLAGTSRSEVFSNGLSGACINPAAFRALIYQDQRSFVQEEHIGGLEYSSGYITWQDENRQPAALLNLLYFGEREALIDRVTELSAAALNVSVLALIFAIVLAMIISRTITQPLRMIQEKISQVSIDNVNNKITSYQTDDEIGSLVKAYNRVVDELTANIQKLARSEREAVWREMAKQVSHEINNPLTPMKLSIQHLQRAWVNQSDKFNGYMETIPKMLVEQIDLLSSIAQEFSS
ncbi:MAG: HAMP domain-containing protein, partial [Bacteroidales bacterium]|nr:HAMP domain-containing protein [Bacteroidales bacterium]